MDGELVVMMVMFGVVFYQLYCLTLSFSDVTILNRAQHGDRLKNFDVRIGNDKHNYQSNPTCHDRVGQARDNEAVRVQCKPPLPGRYVRVQMFGRGILTMCEVLVYSRLGEPS